MKKIIKVMLIIALSVNAIQSTYAAGSSSEEEKLETPTLDMLYSEGTVSTDSAYKLEKLDPQPTETPDPMPSDTIIKYLITETQKSYAYGGGQTYEYSEKTANPIYYTYTIKPGVTSHARIFNVAGQSIADVEGHFLNLSSASGGAIYNSRSQIGNITGDFVGNFATSTSNYAFGGAIYNRDNCQIGDITGDFIGNYADTSSSYYAYAEGGAIYNKNAQIGDLTGDFIGNYATTLFPSFSSEGGVIYNESGTIGDITGDFIGNYAYSPDASFAYGGAIRNKSSTIGNITGNFINNNTKSDYAANTTGHGGGAISNSGSGASIAGIKGDFINNYVENVGAAYGGAIVNYNGALIGEKDADGNITGGIEGDFIGNHASSSATAFLSYGGAIYNSERSKIGNITCDFIANYASASASHSYGGAIYNSYSSRIENIIGDFIGNYAFASYSANGGAIYNYSSSRIGVISGNFIENYASGTNVAGGAIGNFSSGGSYYSQIGKILGNFIRNYIFGTGNNRGNVVSGGAIFNQGAGASIGEIEGNFIKNYAENIIGSAKGGGIYNYDKAQIGNITGDFIGNYASSFSSSNAYGGAIYNEGGAQIGEITGDFIGNYVSTPSFSALGGAIYNSTGGTLTVKDGSFINNRVISSSASRYGGAIYMSDGTVNIISDNKDVEFTGNFSASKDNGDGTFENKKSDAVFLANSSTILNLNAGNHKIVFNDKITSGSGGPTININMTGTWDKSVSEIADGNKLSTDAPTTGTVVLNEDMRGYTGNVNIYGGTVKLGENGIFFNAVNTTVENTAAFDLTNNKIQTTALPKLTLNGNLNLKTDVDLAVSKGDELNITGAAGSSNNIKITGINFISDMQDGQDKSIIQILNGSGASALTLDLDSALNHIYNLKYAYDASVRGNDSLEFVRTERIAGLSGAVSDPDDSTYVILADETFTGWLSPSENNQQGSVINIEGNGNNYDGNAMKGIVNTAGQTVTVKNAGFSSDDGAIEKSWSNFNSEKGGAFNTDDGTINIIDSVIAGNSASAAGGAVYNKGGFLNIAAQDRNTVFGGNKANGVSNAVHLENGIMNLNANTGHRIIFNDSITSNDAASAININAAQSDESSALYTERTGGEVVVNEDMSGYKGAVNLYKGTIKLGENGTFFENAANFNVYGGTLDLTDGVIRQTNLGNITIFDELGMIVDADLANGEMDKILAANVLNDTSGINVTRINLLSDAADEKVTLNFADESVKDAVSYTGGDTAYSKIYKYHPSYNNETGDFDFIRYNSPNPSENFNPSVLASSVAAQVGSYLTQLNSYQLAFANMDMRMLMTKEQRNSVKYANKYASNDTNSPMVFSPLYSPELKKGAWFRPYATFENVPLANGPKVTNTAYGSLMGADSDLLELKHGWEAVYSAYAGYNGSHQAYQGVSIYQNGGLAGLTSVFYKGNFFSALTANAGANSGEASGMYGRDNFTMLTAGIASKSGYNWELADGRFIIQPSYMMSYTFVNTFDYHTASGLSIKSDPLNAIQIRPGIKLIGNLKNGWQPYIGVNMVWNIMDDTRFKANDVSLPQLSVDPFVEYGAGVQKFWGERFSGFFQTMLRNGGRNGVALSLGFRWTI